MQHVWQKHAPKWPHAGLDALFVTDPSNMAWLAGYRRWSFYVHQGVPAHPRGPACLVGRAMDSAGCPAQTTYLEDDISSRYDDTYVPDPDKQPDGGFGPPDRRPAGLENARMGFRARHYYFTRLWFFLTLQTNGYRASTSDAHRAVKLARARQIPPNWNTWRRAAGSLKRMHEVIPRKRSEVGMRKKRSDSRNIYHASVSGAHGHWGDYPACVPMTPPVWMTRAAISHGRRPCRNNERHVL